MMHALLVVIVVVVVCAGLAWLASVLAKIDADSPDDLP